MARPARPHGRSRAHPCPALLVHLLQKHRVDARLEVLHGAYVLLHRAFLFVAETLHQVFVLPLHGQDRCADLIALKARVAGKKDGAPV